MDIGAEIESRIRRLMAVKKMQVGDLQKKAGVNDKYLQQMKAQTLGPTVGKLRPIKAALDVTWDELLEDNLPRMLRTKPAGLETRAAIPAMEGAGDMVSIPERDIRIAAGGGSIVEDEAVRRSWGLPTSFLFSLSAKRRALEFVEIVGDSMYPQLWPGDLVLLDTQSKKPDHRAIYAVWDGNATVCKWVERDRAAKTPTYLLTSENIMHPPYRIPADGDDTKIIGRVIWFGRRL